MEVFQETGRTPLAHTLLNSSSKASRLGCGSCARISEVMVSSPWLVFFLHLDKAIRKALIVNGSLKGWSSAGRCPPWTLQNAHPQRRICAPGNPQNDYCYCWRPRNTSLRALLSPCWLYSWHRPSSALELLVWIWHRTFSSAFPRPARVSFCHSSKNSTLSKRPSGHS